MKHVLSYIYSYIFIYDIWYMIIYYQELQGPKKIEKTGFLVKNPYFGFCCICTILSKSGGPVSNFSALHVGISYWQLVKSVRQNARSKPKQALSDTMRAFSISYAANFPFSETGGSQKVTMDMHGISKASFSDMHPVNWQYSSGNLRCFLFVWIGQLPVRS